MKTTTLVITLFLTIASSAHAAPTILEYRTQERRVPGVFPDTIQLDMLATKLNGSPFGTPPTILDTWTVILDKHEVGRTFTLTAQDAAFARFHDVAAGVMGITHMILMITDHNAYTGPEFYTTPIGAQGDGTFPAFDLNRVEVTLTEYFTSPIGSIVQWNTRLIGNVPEPAAWLMLCVGGLFVHASARYSTNPRNSIRVRRRPTS